MRTRLVACLIMSVLAACAPQKPDTSAPRVDELTRENEALRERLARVEERLLEADPSPSRTVNGRTDPVNPAESSVTADHGKASLASRTRPSGEPMVWLHLPLRTYHRPGCSSITGDMTLRSLAEAQRENYAQDLACKHLPATPDGKSAWGGLAQRNSSGYSPSFYVANEPASGSAGDSTSSGGSSGRVHVKGYTRKDGTVVKPHTRSAPKRD